MRTNKTLNDQAILKAKYPDDYNVRKLPRPKAVTGEKLKEFYRLENLRK